MPFRDDRAASEELLAFVNRNGGNFELLQDSGGGSCREQLTTIRRVSRTPAPTSDKLKEKHTFSYYYLNRTFTSMFAA